MQVIKTKLKGIVPSADDKPLEMVRVHKEDLSKNTEGRKFFLVACKASAGIRLPFDCDQFLKETKPPGIALTIAGFDLDSEKPIIIAFAFSTHVNGRTQSLAIVSRPGIASDEQLRKMLDEEIELARKASVPKVASVAELIP